MKYIAHSTSMLLPDGPATILGLPGVRAPGMANQALFLAARTVMSPSQESPLRVFVAGSGCVASALWAARSGAETLCWTDNVAEGQSLHDTLVHHGFECALAAENNTLPVQSTAHRVFVNAQFRGVEAESCMEAWVHLPRGKNMQTELLYLARAVLKPGGRLVFVGAKKEGIKSALKEAQSIFGQAGIVTRKGGYHAGLARRPEGMFPVPELTCDEADVVIDGVPSRLVTCAGVFAEGRLDAGAEALIAGMHIEAGSRVLDMGCGAGVVGLAALRRGAVVTCSDVSARATHATRQTLAANSHPQAPVRLACGATGLPDASFNTLVTNPPFHQGRGIDFEVAQLFIREAARVLRPKGMLYLVANSFLPYEPWIRNSFAKVETAWENRTFRVWKAVK